MEKKVHTNVAYRVFVQSRKNLTRDSGIWSHLGVVYSEILSIDIPAARLNGASRGRECYFKCR